MTHESTNRPHTFIDILDDDSLLSIFYHCRPPVLLVEGDGDGIGSDPWGGRWKCEYWWYSLAWVCRRWRSLILASPSYLGTSLVCRPMTPVADMLAHSPPIPLIIDHTPKFKLETNAARVEEKILLALRHRDRVRRIRLLVHDSPLKRLVGAIDEEFPFLEYLHIQSHTVPDTNLSLPSTLRAPRLRHLVLHNFAFPIGSPLLAGLATLSLQSTPSANFGPNELLQQLSLMPHLEVFRIRVHQALSTQDVDGQSLPMPLSTHATLPALRWFGFGGPSAYMEAVLPRITMPLLKVTEIDSMITSDLLDLISSILFALQSICEAENPKLCNVNVTFYDVHIVVTMYPHKRTEMLTLRLKLLQLYPEIGLSSISRVFEGIRAALTEVEMLTLEAKASWVLETCFGVQAERRRLLSSFNQVRTLHVSGGDLIEGVSRSLQPQYTGESAIEVLPMLRVLSCLKGTHVGESCRSFLAARRDAGHPVTISHH